MAIRRIRMEDDEILRKISKDVEDFEDKKIQELIDDMIETLYAYDGIGLAAVQVGSLKNIIVYDVSEKLDTPQVLVNPVILKSTGEQICEEGCLSFPDKFEYVKRPSCLEIEGKDRYGNKVHIKAKELEAIVLSHESDHLKGVLFIDRVCDYTPPKKSKDKKKKKGKS